MNYSFLKKDYILLGSFDFDGNILETKSECYVIDRETGKEVTILGQRFDQDPSLLGGDNPKYKLHDDAEESFAQYRDFSHRIEHKGAEHLIQDVQDAIVNRRFAPSFESFKKTFLIPARFFSIITARGHSAENLGRAMQIINESVLNEDEKEQQYQNILQLWKLLGKKGEPNRKMALDFYFQEVSMYYGVSSPQMRNLTGIDHELSGSIKKTHAMTHFIIHIRKLIANKIPEFHSNSLSLGFSDDSLSNIKAMILYFQEERKKEILIKPEDKIQLFFTGIQDQFSFSQDSNIRIKQKDGITSIQI